MAGSSTSLGNKIIYPESSPRSRRRFTQSFAFILLAVVTAILLNTVPTEASFFASKDANPDASQFATVNVTAPPNHLAYTATSFNVPVSTSDLSLGTVGTNVTSYQFVVTYDPSVILPQDPAVSVAGTISNNGSVFINDLNLGVLEVTVFRANPFVGAGTLFNFAFTAVGSQGQTSPITFTTFMFNEGNPDDNVASGLVRLVGPTAAGAMLSGRVLSQNGAGLRNAVVTMTDPRGFVRRSFSSSMGYYLFEDVPTGETYVISVVSKRFQFTPRVVTINDDLTDWDFIASSGE